MRDEFSSFYFQGICGRGLLSPNNADPYHFMRIRIQCCEKKYLFTDPGNNESGSGSSLMIKIR